MIIEATHSLFLLSLQLCIDFVFYVWPRIIVVEFSFYKVLLFALRYSRLIGKNEKKRNKNQNPIEKFLTEKKKMMKVNGANPLVRIGVSY